MLETRRLIIRLFEPGDVEAIYERVYADPEVRDPWSAFRGTLSEFQERFRTGRLWLGAPDGFGYRALTRKQDGELVGLMGFQNHAEDDMDWLLMPDGSRNVGHIPGVIDAELTYALGKPYWGQGYATEAGRALIAYGFETLGIDRVINAISPTNARSHALMTRLGFRFLDNGRPEDVIGLLEKPGVRASGTFRPRARHGQHP
jgi:RimJ/RimL family protein N-acetyltransferase